MGISHQLVEKIECNRDGERGSSGRKYFVVVCLIRLKSYTIDHVSAFELPALDDARCSTRLPIEYNVVVASFILF